MKREENDNFDELLDAALSSYAVAEPRPGLAARLLRGIEADAVKRRPRWTSQWVAALGVASFVAVVCAFWLTNTPKHPRTEPAPIAHLETMPLVSPVQPAMTLRPRIAPRRRKVMSRSLPKQRQFPSPAPLTPEERALLSLVEYHKDEIPPALISPPQEIEPIQIAAIQIEPLPDSGSKKEGEQ